MEYRPYSSRQKENETLMFQYHELSQKLRNQICIIIGETIGTDKYASDNTVDKLFKIVWDKFELEHGKLDMFSHNVDYRWRIIHIIKSTVEVDEVLDIIEMSMRLIDKIGESNLAMDSRNATINPKQAVIEINKRFRQSGVGFQYVNGYIVKISNELIHEQITDHAIALLNDPSFTNANEEYMKAHHHYKNGLNKECIAECLKALESTLKIIFTHKGWLFDSKDTLTKLIKVANENNLIPAVIQEQLTGIRTILTGGVNTIRNNIAGHGQGILATKADEETTRFTLNLTGANIIYLIELSKI